MRLCVFLALAGLAVAAQAQHFEFPLEGLQENPPTPSPASGMGILDLDQATNSITYHIEFAGLLAPQTAAHFHVAPPGVNGPVIIPLPLGSPIDGANILTDNQESDLLAGLLYVNIHSQSFPGGEIRGQVIPEPAPISAGSSSHGRPDLSTNRIPLRTGRSASGRRPGTRRRCGAAGMHGSTRCHSASLRISFAMTRSSSERT